MKHGIYGLTADSRDREALVPSVDEMSQTVKTERPPRSVMHSIALGSSAIYLGAIATMALGFFSKAVVARILAPTELGILITGQTVFVMTQGAGQFGLADAVVRFVGLYARKQPGKAKAVVLRSLRIAVSSTTLLGLALAAGALALIPAFPQNRNLLRVIAIFGFALPFATSGDLLAAAFQGLGRFWVKVLLVDWGRAACLIGGALLLLVGGRGSLLGISAVTAAGLIVSAAGMIIWFLRDRYWTVTAAPVEMRNVLAYGVPLFLSLIATWPGSYVVTLMLASKASAQAVAYFSIASTVGNLVYLPTSAIEAAATPAWAGRIAEGSLPELRAEYEFTTRWCLLPGLFVLSVLVLRATEIVRIIYGARYVEAAPILQIVAAIFTFNVATGPTEGLLRSFGHTREIFLGRLIGGIVSLFCAILFVPRFGIYGAVIALGAAALAGISFLSVALFGVERIHPFTWRYAKTVAAALASAVLVSRIVPNSGNDFISVISIACAFAAVYVICLFLLGSFTERDKRMLMRFRRWVAGGEMWHSPI
jgi:O-antigen/teichoic acid export membrane protein